MSDRSLLHRFFRVAATCPRRSFLEWREGDSRQPRTLSYEETARRIVFLAGEIARQLPPGPVLVVCPPGPEFVVGEFALMLASRLPVTVDHLLPPDSLGEVADLFGVQGVFSSPDVFAQIDRPGLRHLPAVLPTVSENPFDPGILLERALPEGRKTVAHLLLTSGTTGRPKGVPLTHGNLLANADAILSRGVYADRDRVLCVLPLHHSYPYMVNLLLPLSVAGTAIFAPDLSPATLREILSQDRITLFPAVPLLWEGFHRRIEEEIGRRPRWAVRLIKGVVLPLSFSLRRHWGINAGRWIFPKFSKMFGPTMKALASGGAALRPEVARDFIAMGVVMLEGYGLTETSPVVSMTAPEDLSIGTVGHPLPGVEVRILPPEEGRPGGRVQVRGASVAACYWSRAGEKTALVDGEGWFDTGDLGRFEDGRLRLVGREKEVLVLPNGKNIFPEAIETRLSRSEGVAEAAVLLEGKALVALIRPDPGSTTSEGGLAGLLEALNRDLPSHSRIAAYETVSEPFPRTRLGKLRRFLLPELYRSARQRRLSQGTKKVARSDSPVFAKVRPLLSRQAGEGVPVVDEARLEADLGFDSLSRIELLSEIEEILGREIPDDLLSEISTVGDLRDKLDSLAPEGQSPAEEILFRPLSPEEEEKVPPRGRDPRALLFRERLLYHLLRGAGTLFFRIRWPRWSREGENFIFMREDPSAATGREKIGLGPGPFVIVANHGSYLDGPLLALMLPPEVLARTLFWGFAPLFDGPLSAFKNLFGIVSIDSSSALSGLRIALQLLKSGRGLGIFPEGERSLDGQLGSFRPGVGTILSRMKVPVLCVAIVGAFDAFPPQRTLPRPGRIELRPGPLLLPSDYAGLTDHDIVLLLENQVRTLRFP